jgi:hypothetical protein
VQVARPVAERLVDAWGGTSRDVDLELERYRERHAPGDRPRPRAVLRRYQNSPNSHITALAIHPSW